MWFLSPSGWPTWADDDSDHEFDLRDAGYVVIDEADVQPAVDAYNAGQPPVLADVVTVGEITDPASAASVALRAASVAAVEEADVFLGKVAADEAGAILAPVRVPTLTVHKVWPNERSTHRIIWGDGLTCWAVSRSRALLKSIDAGRNWSTKYRPGTGKAMGFRDCFIVSGNGDLLALRNDGSESGAAITAHYATAASDGTAWTQATAAFPANVAPLSSQSFCRDETTGYIYFGEYLGSGQDNVAGINLWRSTDNGRTYSIFHTFPGLAAADGPGKIRHIHGVQYDPVSQRVYITTGDNQATAGIYRVNAAGTGVEPVFLNSDDAGWERGRCIGLMFFADYIAWGTDTDIDAALMRLPRTEIGQADPQAEQVYRLNGAAWGTQKARADRSMYLIGASNESSSLDDSAHLYAVDDNGARVWEVGTLGTQEGSPRTINPVGPGGSLFWIASQRFETEFSALCSLDRGFVAAPIAPVASTPRLLQQVFTQSSGEVTVPAGGTHTFGHARVPKALTRFYSVEFGCRVASGTGTLKVRAIKASDSAVVGSVDITSTGYAAERNEDSGDFYRDTLCTADDTILFQLVETGGAASATGTGFVSYGFGGGASYTGGWTTL